MDTMDTTPIDEIEELTFMEELENTKPGSEFAVFICTWLGLIIGIILNINMEGFSIGEYYNEGKIIIFTLCIIISCRIGFIVKQFIDQIQLDIDNILSEVKIP